MFIFLQDNIDSYQKSNRDLHMKLSEWAISRKDFVVEIKPYNKKTSQQNRGYWQLISTLQRYLLDQGQAVSLENVSDWAKIRAGHCVEIDGQLLPKTIKDSKCVKEDIKHLIEWIIAFGVENGIKGLTLTNSQYQEILDKYESK